MNSIWIWLNGKKTIAGAVVANIVPWLLIRGHVKEDTAMLIMGLVNALTGMGLAHKAVKHRATKTASARLDDSVENTDA